MRLLDTMNTPPRTSASTAIDEYWGEVVSRSFRMAVAVALILSTVICALFAFGRGSAVFGIIGLVLAALGLVATIRMMSAKLSTKAAIGICAGAFVIALLLDFLA